MAKAKEYGTREEFILNMRAAADKNLADIYTPEQRQAWAEKTVADYIRRGILVVTP